MGRGEELRPLLPPGESLNAASGDGHLAPEGPPMTYAQTLASFLKGNIGSGFLGLPFAMAHSGYVVGFFATALAGEARAIPRV
jgi:hypothetical protein